jgi:hypothetical protein
MLNLKFIAKLKAVVEMQVSVPIFKAKCYDYN